MWVKDISANKNVELIVEKLLDEEVGRMVQQQQNNNESGSDVLGLNRAKATVLAGEAISSQNEQKQKPVLNQLNMESLAAKNAKPTVQANRYVVDDYDDDFESTGRNQAQPLDDSWDGEF